MMTETGTLYITGVGPGNPELITLKSARLISTATHIAYFAKKGKTGHARTIANSLINPSAHEIRMEYPFTTEISFNTLAYRRGIEEFYDICGMSLGRYLQEGKNIVLLSEGDPFLYGSCLYVFDRLKSFFSVEIIPGIPAMAGAWSAALMPISHGDDVLAIIPGTLPIPDLITKLAACEAAVIMKVGQNLEKIRMALTQTGLLSRAIYIQNATQASQYICPLNSFTEKKAPYFSMILVAGRQNSR